MQTQSSDENSVCPSVCLSVCLPVCLSVKRVNCDKTEELSPYFYTTWKITLPSFLRRRMVGGGHPFYLIFWVRLVGVKLPIFDLFSPIVLHPQHLEKKVQLTVIGSPLHSFQWAQDEHRTLSLKPPLRKNEVSEIWTIICDNSETVWDRMSVTINH